MIFALRVIVAGLAGTLTHLIFITILAGGEFSWSFDFMREMVIRYTIAGVFTLSINWRRPVFVNGLIVGVLMAVHMAFIILTFQGAWSFFQRALITNAVGGAGMAAGAALAVMLIGRKRD